MSNDCNCTEFCKECDSCICSCECPPEVVDTKYHDVTYNVKVVYHKWQGEPLQEDRLNDEDVYSNIEDAIKEWDFGESRPGAHYWDQDACHVMRCPVTKKFIPCTCERI